MKLSISLTVSLLCCSMFLFAQTNDCKDVLYQSNKLYQKGQLTEMIKLLEPCTGRKLDPEQQFEAYRLLALSYQFLNNEKKTYYYAKKMLKLRPDYQKYPNIDPLEFTKLINTFEVRPLLYLGIKAGPNFSSAEVVKSYSTFKSNQTYFATTGYQFGGFAEYMYKPTLSFSADVLMNGIFIKHQVDEAGGWKQTYNETQQYVSLNLSATYSQKVYKELHLNAGAGFGFNSLLNSRVYLELENKETLSIQQATKNATDERNALQTFGSLKAGLAYQANFGTFGLEASYFYFFNTTVNPDKRMNDKNFIFNNQYVNDDISIRMFVLNLSYKMPLFWSIRHKK